MRKDNALKEKEGKENLRMKRTELPESSKKNRDLMLKLLRGKGKLKLRPREDMNLKSPDSLKILLKTTLLLRFQV